MVDERERRRVGNRPRRSSVRTGSRSSGTGSTARRRSPWSRRGCDRTVASFRHEGHDHARGLIGRAERLTWNASDGLEIDGYLLAPAGDGPHPLILHVHGGPVWSYAEWFPRPNLAWLVSRGYAILMPNPRGSTGRGRTFLEAVIGDMGGADALDDLAGVDAFVETRRRRSGADRRHRRQLRRLHVVLAPGRRPALQGVGRDLARDRLLQPALEQQHRRLGRLVPRWRAPGRHAPVPRAQPRLLRGPRHEPPRS